MQLNSDRVRQIMRYAVAVAAGEDDYRRHELGPIHLLKYVYLADLAYAEKHEGRTYTGAPWKFYHFGPWSPSVCEEIQPAMSQVGIVHRRFRGQYQDDVSRWKFEKGIDEEAVGAELPVGVAMAVRRAVREYSNDTTGLLHYVYRTAPMLHAAPNEPLNFLADQELKAMFEDEAVPHEPARKSRKKLKEAQVRFRSRLRKKLDEVTSRQARAAKPPVSSPETVAAIDEWIGSLSGGDPIQPMKGELIVSDEVWKSPARTEPSIP